ncbi:proteasome accessory factor PafA2 family protein [Candidatus Woesearchaeota archaeon]|nr:proteasome accessory factor PafA2 family protein [Candidatus Woesearchaeota archaeon]
MLKRLKMKQRVFGEETEYGCAFIGEDGQAYVPVDHYAILKDAQRHIKFASNQARVYFDLGHIEYATPECLGAHDVVLYSKAGEHMLNELAKQCTEYTPATNSVKNLVLKGRVRFFRHNADTAHDPITQPAPNTFGCHENYSFDSRKLSRSAAPLSLVSQSVREALRLPDSSTRNTAALFTIYQHILPFLITRYAWSGSGNIVQWAGKSAFQLSQRIPCINRLSAFSTEDRSLFNWRDEPHAKSVGRLHVVCGDANMSEYQTYLKFGVTGIVLGMIEDGYHFDDLNFVDGLQTLRALNQTMDFQEQHRVIRRPSMSVLDVQKAYLQSAQQWVRSQQDRELCDIVNCWEETLVGLADNDPLLERRLDWAAKKSLIDARAAKPGSTHRTLDQINLQYHDIDPDKGLYSFLVKNGMMDTMLCKQDICVAASRPPEGSRAATRSAVLNRLEYWKRRGRKVNITHVSWDSIWYKVNKFGIEVMHNVALPTPYDTSEKTVGEVDKFITSKLVFHTDSVVNKVRSSISELLSAWRWR